MMSNMKQNKKITRKQLMESFISELNEGEW